MRFAEVWFWGCGGGCGGGGVVLRFHEEVCVVGCGDVVFRVNDAVCVNGCGRVVFCFNDEVCVNGCGRVVFCFNDEVCVNGCGCAVFRSSEVRFGCPPLFSAGSRLGSLDRALETRLRLNSWMSELDREATPFPTGLSPELALSALDPSEMFVMSKCSGSGLQRPSSVVMRL